MCGIAGIFSYAGSAPPVDRDELLRIRESMIRRGPDGAGLWISSDRRIGLAHRRLAIIDLSDAGAQPMSTMDGRYRITFNGEIYNYQELRKELEKKGYVFCSNSDTEVLLHLYADRGEDMVHVLRGMYAFAISDEGRKGVFLARDPFGIKPLYYSDDGQCVRFASQVKALVTGGGITGHPDARGYVGFMIWGCVPEPFTLYREIQALPAGNHMWVGASGVGSPVPFFSIREEFANAEHGQESITGTSRVEQVLGALQDSVRHHMVADVPVAAFLSAGLDSATLVASAPETMKKELRTLTLGFREYIGSANDETELARLIAGHYSLSNETRWTTRDDFETSLQDMFAAMDQPSTDGVNTYLVSKAAAEAGTKVALSGLGGDELFGGYPSFTHVPRIRRMSRASGLTPSAGRSLRKAVSPLLKRFTSPKYAGLFEYGQSHGGAYLLRRALFMPWELPDLMDPEFAANGWDELRSLPSLDASTRGLKSDRNIVSALELTWYMRNQLLRDSDWAGMAHSLEIRLPYVDVKFFRAVLQAGTGGAPLYKADLARALNPSLPEAVVERSKSGFVVPVREWCGPPATEPALNRGLRGWAQVVIGDSLFASGASAQVRPAHATRAKMARGFTARSRAARR